MEMGSLLSDVRVFLLSIRAPLGDVPLVMMECVLQHLVDSFHFLDECAAF